MADDEVGHVLSVYDATIYVLASNAVYRGFNARSGQTKVYEIGICGFIAKHAVQKGKSNESG
jgi:hypothetical protein